MLRNFAFLTLIFMLTACGGNKTYHLKTSDANGVKAGDKVLRQGVEIGEVKAVGFADDEQVDITISTEDALFEDQGFSFTRDDNGNRAVELNRPATGAKELASGATLENKVLDLEVNFSKVGDALEKGLDAFLGKDGLKLEELGQVMEKFGDQTAEGMEAWGQKMEAWAKEHEDEFKELEVKLEKWGKKNEGAMEDFSKEMERISEEFEVGSQEWRRELKQSLKKLEEQ